MGFHLLLCAASVVFGAILIASGTYVRLHRERTSHDGDTRLVIGVLSMAIPMAYTIALFALAIRGVSTA